MTLYFWLNKVFSIPTSELFTLYVQCFVPIDCVRSRYLSVETLDQSICLNQGTESIRLQYRYMMTEVEERELPLLVSPLQFPPFCLWPSVTFTYISSTFTPFSPLLTPLLLNGQKMTRMSSLAFSH